MSNEYFMNYLFKPRRAVHDTVCFVLGFSCFFSVGCKPSQQKVVGTAVAEEATHQPIARLLKSAPQSDTPTGYNREFHVIKTIWAELEKCPEQDARRGLMLETLRTKTASFQANETTLSDDERALLNRITAFLAQTK